MNRLLAIVGPTASGKSALAMQIANKYNGEIVCADSRTVYKGMDVGTSKPSKEDQEQIPHHLLDIVEPGQTFTAADFKNMADEAIDNIQCRGKLPILVGGTGLYVDSIIYNYRFGRPADPEARARLAGLSVEQLQQMCRDKNIELPFNVQNRRHLIRSLEIGGLIKRSVRPTPNTLVVGISTEGQELIKRIEHRAKAMIAQGVIEEARVLGQKYGWDNEALKSNIYRALRPVVESEKTIEEALPDIIRRDKALAKRQLTWFKRDGSIVWGTPKELLKKVANFLSL